MSITTQEMFDFMDISSMSYEELVTKRNNIIGFNPDNINECLEAVNTEEMGEVIDMIKDIEKTLYYATLIETMKHENSTKTIYEKSISLEDRMKYLQNYLTEFAEMVELASLEEKQLIKNKMTELLNQM